MALTKQAKDILGARCIDDEQTLGERTPTGMIRTKKGTLVVPSNMVSPKTFRGDLVVDEDGVPVGAQPTPAPVKQEAAPEPAKRGRKRKAAKDEPEKQIVTITMNGLGKVTSQYVFCSIGNDNAVLGLDTLSFVPEVALRDDQGNFKNVLKLSADPNSSYIFTGSSFNVYGVKAIFLVKIA